MLKTIKDLYRRGRISAAGLGIAVERGLITPEEHLAVIDSSPLIL